MTRKKLEYKEAFSLIELSITILIIGLIIVGLTKGSSMVKKAEKISCQWQNQGITSNNSSEISVITNGLQVWLDAASEESFNSNPSDGDLIQIWNDLSGNNNNATQGNSDKKPSYKAGIINNLTALQFDGDWMNLGDILGRNSDDELTFFIVFQPTAANTFIIAKQDNFVDGKGYAIRYESTQEVSLRIMGHQSTNKILSSTTDIIELGSPGIATFSYDGSLSEVGVGGFISGKEQNINDNDTLTMNPSPNGGEPLYIGAREGATFGLYQGFIGEILLYDRELSALEIQAMHNYLQSKWNLGDVDSLDLGKSC